MSKKNDLYVERKDEDDDDFIFLEQNLQPIAQQYLQNLRSGKKVIPDPRKHPTSTDPAQTIMAEKQENPEENLSREQLIAMRHAELAIDPDFLNMNDTEMKKAFIITGFPKKEKK